MPDITGVGNSLLRMTSLAGQGNTTGAMDEFRGVLRDTLGEDAVTMLDQNLHAQDSITRTDVPTTSFGSPTGDVAALGDTVAQAVSNRLDKVTESEAKSAADKQTLLTGGDIEMHNVILSAERAQLELQLTMQLRNKLLEAYQEVMRMPL
jgi:flagellar hook-basal body complex protein FliE